MAKGTVQPTEPKEPNMLNSCFVMMPYRHPFEDYYRRVFMPAIEDANLEPVLANDLFRAGSIVEDMWTQIQEAKVLLAILTGQNANVFYELGLAHAIGKPIVMVSETMSDVPFDLQALRTLTYDKDDPEYGLKLRGAITKAIVETIDDPVQSVPPAFRKIVQSQAPEQTAVLARLDELEGMLRVQTATTRRTPSNDSILQVNSPQLSETERAAIVRDERALAAWIERQFNLGYQSYEIRRKLSNMKDLDPNMTADLVGRASGQERFSGDT